MFDIFTVSFFGHREVEHFSYIEAQVSGLIRELLQTKEYVEFLIGRNGEFDQIVSSAVRRAKKNYRDDNCSHVLVLPYENAEFRDNEESYLDYYDDVEIMCGAGAHFKAAIQMRNREMVDRSDLVVFYLERGRGGAYQTYRYAAKCGKRIIRLKTDDMSRI